jgi:RNA polymerase sigma-70 factor, ECF subfamily
MHEHQEGRGIAMSSRQAPTGDFDTDLTQLLPRLRIYALSLTRDPVRADDLVQQTVLRSLAGRASFRRGTNFPGWLFRIQRNEFISGLRRERPTVELNDAIASTLMHAQRQESGLVMREFMKAFRTLGGGQRRALLMTALEGQSHETIAGASGVSIGTVKSRVSRARARLREMLDLEVGDFTLAGPARPVGHAAPVA